MLPTTPLLVRISSTSPQINPGTILASVLANNVQTLVGVHVDNRHVDSLRIDLPDLVVLVISTSPQVDLGAILELVRTHDVHTLA